ncbi:translation initiation factor IF-2 [Subdoligranulum sp. APC924/74]|uniref:translation initiation factor IF-2 n=1 Tax=Subdoligranulum sp. APC924/74 TaxID=2086273 RepID=UPI000DEB47C7|nr:translation initiation factor IF-2 [Subdoligranulum sp. APC924/74]RCH52279.1 translation initiation factor IF-2 [Subdoligranulum sp. APC924/74]
MVDFKYKVTDIAKDFGISTKKVIETFAELTGETRKTGATFEENEVNALMEALTRETAVKDLGEYLASGKEPQPVKQETKKPEAKPQAKKEEPKPEAAKPQPKQPKQPEAPKAEPKAEQAKPAQNAQPKAAQPKPAQQEKRNDKRNDNKQAEKRSEKRVTMQELASETGIKEPVATEQVKVDRAQVSVDTRTVDVNVDKFSARYDDLADSRNMPSKRKNAPTGKKEKFNNRNNRRGQQFGRRRETEAERLQRIQLEKARNAQLKISIPDEITVGELATRLKQNVAKVVAKFMQMGEMHAASDVIDFDSAALIAEEFHAKVEHEVHVSIEERLFTQEEDSADQLVERPPVVVVMGHVDHGKTSILDRIRSTNVTAGEAGGITQAIGAYQVNVNGSPVTFLDTPGHEAFTAMRARGADMTDIAVLVVAADDGIMPQTIESINHAKAANVKLIVAINKMDKPTANPERVKEQLTKYEIVPEDWGGETACIPVSAATGAGIQDLLERIVLEAEVMELKANPNRRAKGAVVEARLDKGQGTIATLLVQNGTLHKGDCLIAGTAVGRVRTMRNDKGVEIESAGPSTPVEITGLTEVPTAGDIFEAVEDERLARELADKRTTEAKEKQFAAYTKVTLDNLFDQMAQNDMKELPIVVKADVQGSAEAVKQSLEKLSNEEVRVRVIHAGVGAISKSDVSLADASNAIIIGFNVRPDAVAKAEAEQAGVEMRMYRVIYDAINDVSDAMKGMLAPKVREVALGEAQVRQVYKISSVGTVSGCRVTSGKITRDAQLRLVRDGIVICEDAIASLKRFKDDAKEVAEGYECGITLQKFSDVKEGDVFECFKLEEYRD